MSEVEVIYGKEELVPSFYQTLGEVAREKIYIELIEPPPYDSTIKFFQELRAADAPVYYAVEDGARVVGWADISSPKNPRMRHRGSLGMGVLASHRGQGIGGRLLSAALAQAKKIGLEKVELSVYSVNVAAIALYEKMGFARAGCLRSYRKLEDGRVFDAVMMEKFL